MIKKGFYYSCTVLFSAILVWGVLSGSYAIAQPELDRSWIFPAASSGHFQKVRRILDHFPGAVHLKDKDGRTPLHLAVKNGHHETVRVLLNRAAKVADRDKKGWMPLHYAAEFDHPPCARILLDRGAPINAPTTDDEDTPLHLAAQLNRFSTAKLLVDRGAAINPRNRVKKTPLGYVDGYDLKAFPDLYRERSALRELLKSRGATL
jgi:ankyrin repeat protein